MIACSAGRIPPDFGARLARFGRGNHQTQPQVYDFERALGMSTAVSLHVLAVKSLAKSRGKRNGQFIRLPLVAQV